MRYIGVTRRLVDIAALALIAAEAVDVVDGDWLCPSSLIHQPRRDFHRDRPRLALGHLSPTFEAFYRGPVSVQYC